MFENLIIENSLKIGHWKLIICIPNAVRYGLVGMVGIEPTTSILSEWHSTTELHAQNIRVGQRHAHKI